MKKRGKRSLTGIAAIILTLFLTGCAGIHAQKMSEPELVIGGSVYTPYFYRDVNGEYVGIDVEVAKDEWAGSSKGNQNLRTSECENDTDYCSVGQCIFR